MALKEVAVDDATLTQFRSIHPRHHFPQLVESLKGVMTIDATHEDLV